VTSRQLDSTTIRPDYLKWTLKDFPESITREMLRIIRQKRSRRIFRVFPNLMTSGGDGDFWSSGYLVDKQNREFSTQALMTHIAKNRLPKAPIKKVDQQRRIKNLVKENPCHN